MLIFLKLLEYIYKLYREQFVRQLPQVIRTSYWYIVSQHIERSKNCIISKSFFMPNTCTTATWLSVSSFSWLWINSNKKHFEGTISSWDHTFSEPANCCQICKDLKQNDPDYNKKWPLLNLAGKTKCTG